MGFELINITNYNPNTTFFKTSASDREEITYWYCNNKGNCEAFKNGNCIMFNKLFASSACPYGKKKKTVGFTKRARKCGELEREAKKTNSDKFYALKEQMNFARIGDYVLLPIIDYCLYMSRYPFYPTDSDFWCKDNKQLINANYFNAETISKLCEYTPIAYMSNQEITKYKNKLLPEFLYKLQKYDNYLFKEACQLNPLVKDIAEKFSPIGKKAKLASLSRGKVKLGTHPCDWNGEIITFLDVPVLFGQKGLYYFKPNSDAVAEIVDECTVNDNTEFIN